MSKANIILALFLGSHTSEPLWGFLTLRPNGSFGITHMVGPQQKWRTHTHAHTHITWTHAHTDILFFPPFPSFF